MISIFQIEMTNLIGETTKMCLAIQYIGASLNFAILLYKFNGDSHHCNLFIYMLTREKAVFSRISTNKHTAE